jgi:hypothetical protein
LQSCASLNTIIQCNEKYLIGGAGMRGKYNLEGKQAKSSRYLK